MSGVHLIETWRVYMLHVLELLHVPGEESQASKCSPSWYLRESGAVDLLNSLCIIHIYTPITPSSSRSPMQWLERVLFWWGDVGKLRASFQAAILVLGSTFRNTPDMSLGARTGGRSRSQNFCKNTGSLAGILPVVLGMIQC